MATDVLETPDVSVIIAAYNAELFVHKAIHSALNQLDVRVEVIVVDDASSDNTVEVVAAIDDPRVKLFKHTKNQWAGTTRNTGIDHAQGKWIAILDSDDEFELDRLKTLKALAEQTNSQLVCDNLLICDQSKSTAHAMFATQSLEAINPMTLTMFIQGNLGGARGYTLGYFKPLIRRGFLDKHNIRYPTNMNLGEDYYILADLLAAGAKCAIHPSPLYRYNVRAGSMSHRLTISDTDNILREGRAFEQRHTFDRSVLPMLKKRRSYVERNRAFLLAIEAIKNKSVSQLLKNIIKHPRVIVLLMRSLIARK